MNASSKILLTATFDYTHKCLDNDGDISNNDTMIGEEVLAQDDTTDENKSKFQSKRFLSFWLKNVSSHQIRKLF